MQVTAPHPHRYIALLRAINVGGHNVKMQQLREVFEALGCTEVSTFIASGNVRFTSSLNDPVELAGCIEAQLFKTLGYPVATFIRTPRELAAIADHQPFPPEELSAAHALHVVFLPGAPTPEAASRLQILRGKVDDFQLVGCEVYWLRRESFQTVTVSGAHLEKALAIPATARNITTVRKLAALETAQGMSG